MARSGPIRFSDSLSKRRSLDQEDVTVSPTEGHAPFSGGYVTFSGEGSLGRMAGRERQSRTAENWNRGNERGGGGRESKQRGRWERGWVERRKVGEGVGREKKGGRGGG